MPIYPLVHRLKCVMPIGVNEKVIAMQVCSEVDCIFAFCWEESSLGPMYVT